MGLVDEREKFLKLDAKTQRWVEKQYRLAFKDLKAHLRKIGKRIATEGPTTNLVSQQARLEALIKQTEYTLQVLAGKVQAETLSLSRQVAEEAALAARGVTGAPPSQFGQIPTDAVVAQATKTVQGGAVEQLLAKRIPGFVEEIRGMMVRATVEGWGPRKLAREAERVTGKQSWNARTIMRTEMARARNTAALEVYRAAPDIEEWQWLATLDSKTCSYCWGQHGQIFSVNAPFAQHPNCRCTAVPVVDEPIQTAEKMFKQYTPETQDKILGPTRAEMYRKGDIQWGDWCESHIHPVWGPTGKTLPLKRTPGYVEKPKVMKAVSTPKATPKAPVAKPAPTPNPKPLTPAPKPSTGPRKIPGIPDELPPGIYQTDKGGFIDIVSAAERMFGKGSPQVDKARKRYAELVAADKRKKARLAKKAAQAAKRK